MFSFSRSNKKYFLVRTGELLLNGHRVSDGEDEKVLETDDVGHTTM